jgi:Holliday junction resolvasome RuvABC endonuclease subunit
VRLLAFDASSTTGWAYFASAREAPLLGSFKLTVSGADYGAVMLQMQQKVIDLVAHHRPDVVACEAPVFLPRDRWHTRRLLGCMVDIIELVAAERALPCIEVTPQQAKAALGGHKADKAGMMAAARTMGWPVRNDHEADACGVGLAAYAQLQQKAWAAQAQA